MQLDRITSVLLDKNENEKQNSGSANTVSINDDWQSTETATSFMRYASNDDWQHACVATKEVFYWATK